jgi:hypothetical protein
VIELSRKTTKLWVWSAIIALVIALIVGAILSRSDQDRLDVKRQRLHTASQSLIILAETNEGIPLSAEEDETGSSHDLAIAIYTLYDSSPLQLVGEIVLVQDIELSKNYGSEILYIVENYPGSIDQALDRDSSEFSRKSPGVQIGIDAENVPNSIFEDARIMRNLMYWMIGAFLVFFIMLRLMVKPIR